MSLFWLACWCVGLLLVALPLLFIWALCRIYVRATREAPRMQAGLTLKRRH